METNNNINYEYCDKKTALKLIESNYELIAFLSPTLQDDEDVILTAIRLESFPEADLNNPVFKYASPRLRSKRNIVLNAVKKHGEVIQYASPDFDNDKEIILSALENLKSNLFIYDGYYNILSSIVCDYISPKIYDNQKIRDAMGYINEKITFNNFFEYILDVNGTKDLRKKNLEEHSKKYLHKKKERIVEWEKELELWEKKVIEWKNKLKEQKHEIYVKFRKDLEQMPIYQGWKKDVINKNGKECQINKSHSGKKTEVHHIESLYSIYLKNKLISSEDIIKCKQLWNIDNGIVLCKECHDTMESSKNREVYTQKTK